MAFTVLRQLKQVKKNGTKSTFYIFNEADAYGRKGIDIRENFERSDGSIQHTKKGMFVSFEAFNDFVDAINEVREQLQETVI
jgi:hypothetical protein